MRKPLHEALEAGPQLSVSVNGADLLHLERDLSILQDAGIRLLHIDVMDGVFCPQMTGGPAFVRVIPDTFFKDVHLMIDEPLRKVHDYITAGADIITFHVEATQHAHHLLQELAETEVLRGVAINPGTPLTAIEPLVDELDYVLVLGVNPGWPGQRFFPTAAARLAATRRLIEGRKTYIGIDGGITKENVQTISCLGADVIVAGSAVFDGSPLLESAQSMRQLACDKPGAADVRSADGDRLTQHAPPF